MLAIYVDDLLHELTLCKFGFNIDGQYMNRVTSMYADDICLIAPSVIGLQRMYIDGRQPKTRISKFAIVQETKKTDLFCNVTLDCA